MTERYADNDMIFRSSALDAGDLFLLRFEGREAISRLPEYELLVESRFEGALDFDQVDEMLAGTAYVAFGAGEEHPLRGVLASIDMLPATSASRVRYRMRLVPRMWYLTLTVGSWIYQDMTVQEIVRDVLKSNELTEGEDFEFHLTGKYPKREYTVQYQESDFDFVCRLLEHEGIWFVFEHGEKDKIVIADANESFLELAGHETVAFDPRGGAAGQEEVVLAIGRRMQRVSSKVIVKDYNWRTPSVQLRAGVWVDQAGRGTRVLYGDHFKDLDNGKRLAKIRAQEVFVQKETYGGQTRVRGLRAGHRFTLADHYLDAMDQAYLVTAVRHRIDQSPTGESGTQVTGYANEIDAIPLEVPFRPARVTPRPRIYGIISAKVDGVAAEDGSAPVNEEGCYKVHIPFDTTGGKPGRASRYVRMAQPYSGANYGMHFPLHVGTEVMLTHVDGDPDRPIIAASLPNPETSSPVTTANAQINRIRTRSGMMMGFHDRKGG